MEWVDLGDIGDIGETLGVGGAWCSRQRTGGECITGWSGKWESRSTERCSRPGVPFACAPTPDHGLPSG